MDMDITNSTVTYDPGPPPNAATEKQINFIFKLVSERDVSGLDMPDPNMMNKKQASVWIDQLLSEPKTVGSTTNKPDPDAGFYYVDEHVYKVQVAVHGSGRKYAKVLVPDPYGVDKGTWEYAGRKPFHLLDETTKLTLEKAKELGHLYGICCICGATLTNESSIEAGIGPVCATKF
jgi:hypothetical protein